MEYLTSAHLRPTATAWCSPRAARSSWRPRDQGRLVRGHRASRACATATPRFLPDGKTPPRPLRRDRRTRVRGAARPTASARRVRLTTRRHRPPLRGHALARRPVDRLHRQEPRPLAARTSPRRRRPSCPRIREIGDSDVAWSPDSRLLAFVAGRPEPLRPDPALPALETARPHAGDQRSTSTATAPAWSPDGQWLYFLSDRNLRLGRRRPLGAAPARAVLRQADEDLPGGAARRGCARPSQPADELHPAEPDEKKADPRREDDGQGRHDGEDRGKPRAEDRRSQRWSDRARGPRRSASTRCPSLPAITAPAVDREGALLARVAGARRAEHKQNLHGPRDRDKEPEAETIARGNHVVPAVARQQEAPRPQEGRLLRVRCRFQGPGRARPRTSSTSPAGRFPLDPREDWRQIFVDAWRLERDYFYDPGTHGVEWKAVLDKHMPLVDRITDRDELSDLIGGWSASCRRSTPASGAATCGRGPTT